MPMESKAGTAFEKRERGMKILWVLGKAAPSFKLPLKFSLAVKLHTFWSNNSNFLDISHSYVFKIDIQRMCARLHFKTW